MKRLIFTSLIVCFIATQSFAQRQSFAKNDNVVGIGIGLGGNLYSGLGFYPGIKRMPTIMASYERCIIGKVWDNKSSIGVGGVVGYTSAKWNNYGWGWKQNSTLIAARGALHYAFIPKLDVYAGFTLGYNIVKWKWTGEYEDYNYTKTSASGVTGAGYVGARYYFTNFLGAYAELGYGYSIFNLGLSLKF